MNEIKVSVDLERMIGQQQITIAGKQQVIETLQQQLSEARTEIVRLNSEAEAAERSTNRLEQHLNGVAGELPAPLG